MVPGPLLWKVCSLDCARIGDGESVPVVDALPG